VKTELRIVFLARDGKAFLTKAEALSHENENKETSHRRNMTIADLIQKMLEDNNWGVYYKAKPLQNLQVQDGVPLLRVNDVDLSTVTQEVNTTLNKLEEGLCKKLNHSQADSQQEKS
tara:strand:+ start:33 stop:383 length:351 start_codon:yes stop_codon:yes gene_type:complete